MSVSSGPVCRGLVLLGGPLRVRPLCCVPRSLVFSFSLFMFICLVGQGLSCLVGLLSHGWPLWPCSHFFGFKVRHFCGRCNTSVASWGAYCLYPLLGLLFVHPCLLQGSLISPNLCFLARLGVSPCAGSLSWPSGEASCVAGARLCSYAPTPCEALCGLRAARHARRHDSVGKIMPKAFPINYQKYLFIFPNELELHSKKNQIKKIKIESQVQTLF